MNYYARLSQIAFGSSNDESFTHLATSEDSPINRPAVARGDSLLDEGEETRLKSELPSVSDACWTQFVNGMITADCDAVSASNALGMFEIMPRRLEDLGIVTKLSRSRSPQGRTVYVAVFKAPMTSDKFLRSPQIQYKVFSASMKDYSNKINNGEIIRGDIPLSGALAILHRCGPNGLKTWESAERFPTTQATYDRVSGLF